MKALFFYNLSLSLYLYLSPSSLTILSVLIFRQELSVCSMEKKSKGNNEEREQYKKVKYQEERNNKTEEMAHHSPLSNCKTEDIREEKALTEIMMNKLALIKIIKDNLYDPKSIVLPSNHSHPIRSSKVIKKVPIRKERELIKSEKDYNKNSIHFANKKEKTEQTDERESESRKETISFFPKIQRKFQLYEAELVPDKNVQASGHKEKKQVFESKSNKSQPIKSKRKLHQFLFNFPDNKQ